MTAFSDQLVEANRDVWAAMAGHPLVLGLAEGTHHAWIQNWLELAFWEMCWSGQAWQG
jgi:thiaminase